MICKNCGAPLEEGVSCCDECGAQVDLEEAAPKTVAEELAESSGDAKKLGIASMICAIVAAARICFSSVVCIPLPVVPLIVAALVLWKKSGKTAKDLGQKKSGFALAGLIVGIASAVLFVGALWNTVLVGVIFTVLGVLLCLAGIAVPPMLATGVIYLVVGVVVLLTVPGLFLFY